ncbi:alcohol dehydrogenase catalytic domain-containing protein [Nonomuraea wenchangensis]
MAAGSAVTTVKQGDRLLVSCITACGRCRYCRTVTYGQRLGGGGWILGHRIDGTQAEYVRVPFADTSTHELPEGASDEAALMLADILPTSYEVGVLNGRMRPGDSVVVVGAGPIGLAAITTARLFTPSHIVAVDLAASRLEAAKRLGAWNDRHALRQGGIALSVKIRWSDIRAAYRYLAIVDSEDPVAQPRRAQRDGGRPARGAARPTGQRTRARPHALPPQCDPVPRRATARRVERVVSRLDPAAGPRCRCLSLTADGGRRGRA